MTQIMIPPAATAMDAELLPPAPTPPVDVEAEEPLRWIPRGLWSHRGGNPLELSLDGDGTVILTLKTATHRPGVYDLGARRDSHLGRLRVAVLDQIAKHPAYKKVLDLRPQVLQAKRSLDHAREAFTRLERSKADLLAQSPPPKNLAARLVGLTADLDQGSARLKQADLELRAIKPIWTDAVTEIEQAIPRLLQEAQSGLLKSEQDLLANLIAELLEQISGQLTEAAALKRALGGFAIPSVQELLNLALDGPAIGHKDEAE